MAAPQGKTVATPLSTLIGGHSLGPAASGRRWWTEVVGGGGHRLRQRGCDSAPCCRDAWPGMHAPASVRVGEQLLAACRGRGSVGGSVVLKYVLVGLCVCACMGMVGQVRWVLGLPGTSLFGLG